MNARRFVDWLFGERAKDSKVDRQTEHWLMGKLPRMPYFEQEEIRRLKWRKSLILDAISTTKENASKSGETAEKCVCILKETLQSPAPVLDTERQGDI